MDPHAAGRAASMLEAITGARNVAAICIAYCAHRDIYPEFTAWFDRARTAAGPVGMLALPMAPELLQDAIDLLMAQNVVDDVLAGGPGK